MIITIDGGAGTGKSTLARLLAAYYDFEVLNTGVLYRSVALICNRMGIDPKDEHDVVPISRDMPCPVVDGTRVYLGSHDVTQELFSLPVSNTASITSRYPMVRKNLLPFQRELAQQTRKRGVVTEGRDQGTIVFSNAEVKFFFTASPEVRAQRRVRDMPEASYEEILADIKDRDNRESKRTHAPLEAAHDALTVDTTNKTTGAVLDCLIEHTNRVMKDLAQQADMQLRLAVAAGKNTPEQWNAQLKEPIQHAKDQI